MSEIKRFGVSMPSRLCQEFDEFIKLHGYKNRSEAIRDLIREKLVVEREWTNPEEEVIGVLVIVYDSTKRELSHKLTNQQHSHYREIISTLHIHMDAIHCLEIIVIKGKVKDVKQISAKLSAMKGVIFAQFAPATIGRKLE